MILCERFVGQSTMRQAGKRCDAFIFLNERKWWVGVESKVFTHKARGEARLVLARVDVHHDPAPCFKIG